jgi:TRAP-type C4-dicarboxylate transport system substrate-binding protein
VDIVPALQTGLIAGGLSSTVFHFFQTRKYATDFALTRHSYDTGAIVLNYAWRAGANADQKKTLDSAWMSSDQARASVRRLTDFSIATMRKEGVRIHELSPEQRAQWVAATKDVTPRLIEEIGGQSRAVHDAILRGKADFAKRQADLAAAAAAASPPPAPATLGGAP